MSHNDEVCDLMAENGRLTKANAELREALKLAEPALEMLVEDGEMDIECHSDDGLCGHHDCAEIGCVVRKLLSVREALANSSEGE